MKNYEEYKFRVFIMIYNKITIKTYFLLNQFRLNHLIIVLILKLAQFRLVLLMIQNSLLLKKKVNII